MRHSLRKDGIFLLLLTVIGGLFYGSTLGGFFLSDDFKIFSTLKLDKGDPFFIQGGLIFRPTSILIIRYLNDLFGLNASVYHLASLGIHIFTSFFIYKIVALIGASHSFSVEKSRWAAYFSTLAFLVYPFHSEAVVWIAGRGVLLAAFFGVLAFYFYLKKENNSIYLFTSFLAFFIALMGYESVWTLPVIFLLYGLYEFKVLKQGSLKQMLFTNLGFWIVFGIYFVIRTVTMLERRGDAGNYEVLVFSPSQLLANLGRFILSSLVPPQLSTTWFLITGGLALIVILALGVYFYKNSNRLVVELVLLLLLSGVFALLPVLHLGIDIHDSECNRYLYFPAVFFVMASSFFLIHLFKNRSNVILSMVLILTYLGFFLLKSNRDWKNAGLISERVVKKISQSYDCQRFYVVNLPEQLNGAYIFRQPMYYTQDLFFPNLPEVKVLSKYPIYSAEEKSPFTRLNDTTWIDGKRDVSLTYFPQSREVRLKNSLYLLAPPTDETISIEGTCIYYFSMGKLQEWNKEAGL